MNPQPSKIYIIEVRSRVYNILKVHELPTRPLFYMREDLLLKSCNETGYVQYSKIRMDIAGKFDEFKIPLSIQM